MSDTRTFEQGNWTKDTQPVAPSEEDKRKAEDEPEAEAEKEVKTEVKVEDEPSAPTEG